MVEQELNSLEEVKRFELMIPYSHLGPGKYFGELALQENLENPSKLITRAATVCCIDNCSFATLNKKDY
jgi:hypothetical protein